MVISFIYSIHPAEDMVSGIGMSQRRYYDVYVYEYMIIYVAWFGRV